MDVLYLYTISDKAPAALFGPSVLGPKIGAENYVLALRSSKAAIILFHNHPSDDPDPSREDRELTRRLVDAGRILGIDVLKHVILGDEGSYFSFTYVAVSGNEIHPEVGRGS